MLAEALVAARKQIFVDMPAGQRPSNQDIQEVLDKEILEAVNAMTQLVQAQNDLFDRITSHGLRSEIPDPNFFRRAFTESMLEDLGFEYSKDIQKIVQSRKYVEAVE